MLTELYKSFIYDQLSLKDLLVYPT